MVLVRLYRVIWFGFGLRLGLRFWFGIGLSTNPSSEVRFINFMLEAV